MSIGSLDSGLPEGGGYVHGGRNYFCRTCGRYTAVEANAPDPRRCSTPGCSRPFGFGRHVPVDPTPRGAGRAQ